MPNPADRRSQAVGEGKQYGRINASRSGRRWQGEVVRISGRDLESAWLEPRFMALGERREACARTCMSRGANIQPLITFPFWAADRRRLAPVWDDLLRSLRLGEYIALPVQRGG